MGLYRDDGLAAIKSTSGPILDKMRKSIIACFKEEGLTIRIDTNLIESDFLDVAFNLATSKFFPFLKPNNVPLYLNAKSNHPSTIIKDLHLSYLVTKMNSIKQTSSMKNHYKKEGTNHRCHALKQK